MIKYILISKTIKELGRGTFAEPEAVSEEECWNSVKDGFIKQEVMHKDGEVKEVKLEVGMGTNAIEMITHGRIHYRSDTPTCQGVNFHFDNRTVMSEILQFNFILYEIQPVDLTWRLEEDIIQQGAKIL